MKFASDEEAFGQGVVHVPEACRLLGLERTTVYKLMSEGTLPFVRQGNRRYPLRSAIKRLLAERSHGVEIEEGDAGAEDSDTGRRRRHA